MEETRKPENPTSTALLNSLIQEIKQVNNKLDIIIDVNRKILNTNKDRIKTSPDPNSKEGKLKKHPDAVALLSLPSSLRQTIMVLYKFDRATADQLAAETKRLRAVESSSANQLVRMGYLKKTREGRDVYFYIDTSETKQ